LNRYLEDASYIRFRNLNIGYKFTKKAWTGLPVDEIRVYTQMQNLFTWTKFNGDPEVGIGSAEKSNRFISTWTVCIVFLSYCSIVPFGLSINL
jgi:hypothetical protein